MRRTPENGSGGHPVPEQAELGHQLFGEHALAGGEDLAELDVGGPERLEGGAESAGTSPSGIGPSRAPGGPTCRAPIRGARPPQGPPAWREPPPPDQPGCLGCDLGAKRVDARPPGHAIRVDQPGSDLRECADVQVVDVRLRGHTPIGGAVTRLCRRDDQAAIVATEAEGVGEHRPRLPRAGLPGDDLDVDIGIRLLVAGSRRDQALVDGQHDRDGLDGPCSAEPCPVMPLVEVTGGPTR